MRADKLSPVTAEIIGYSLDNADDNDIARDLTLGRIMHCVHFELNTMPYL